MYRCNDCGYEFDEPKIIREQQGYYGNAPAWEEWAVCPACLENDYSEITDEEELDPYEKCWQEGNYDDLDCHGCPYASDCSGSDLGDDV